MKLLATSTQSRPSAMGSGRSARRDSRHARPRSSRTAARLTATPCWPRVHWADCAAVLPRTVPPESLGRRWIAWSCCPCWRRACARYRRTRKRRHRVKSRASAAPPAHFLRRLQPSWPRTAGVAAAQRVGTASRGQKKLARHRGGHLSSTCASSMHASMQCCTLTAGSPCISSMTGASRQAADWPPPACAPGFCRLLRAHWSCPDASGVGRLLRAAAGCIFPLGPARERLRVEVALVFRGGWLVSAFE